MKINEIEVRSVITKSNLPGIDYVINPYVGCQHSCIYCYTDFMKKFTGHIDESWGDFVDVKVNAVETIKKPNLENKNILMSSVTDPYQPIEVKHKITKKILKKLVPFQPDLSILTKSDLVYRDIEILKQFENLKVGISLNTLDQKVSSLLEPCATSPRGRIEVLKKLHSEGIKTYLFMSPIFPGITDFKEIVDEVRGCADEIFFENLNIRANNRKKIFQFIEGYNNQLTPLYRSIQENAGYWRNLKREICDYCDDNKIKFRYC